ncbi:headcase protein family like domain-containing protein [Ditylenchus destructor]|uniref:Headcase protein family like domain-containing protein n=1 Tax=Ditylenchus destructor TaxID=166010 RepID=A0AAD4QVT4_9BILA|nr:headcase protein family like domain-containing protein [Ditylenchus destructor]
MAKDKQKKLDKAHLKDLKVQRVSKVSESTKEVDFKGCAIPHIPCIVPDNPLPTSTEDGVYMPCGSEQCPHGKLVHKECYELLQEKLVKIMLDNGCGRNWTKSKCLINMWQKKGAGLIYKVLDCHCGKGKRVHDPNVQSPPVMQPVTEPKKKKKPQLPAVNMGCNEYLPAPVSVRSRKESVRKESERESPGSSVDQSPRGRSLSRPLIPTLRDFYLESPKPTGESGVKFAREEFSQRSLDSSESIDYSSAVESPKPKEYRERSENESYAFVTGASAKTEQIKEKSHEHNIPVNNVIATPVIKEYTTVSEQNMEITKLNAYLDCKYKGFTTILELVNVENKQLVREFYSSMPFACAKMPNVKWQLDLYPFGSADRDPTSRNILFKVKQLGVAVKAGFYGLKYDNHDDYILADVRIQLKNSKGESVKVDFEKREGLLYVFSIDQSIVAASLQPGGSLFVECFVEYVHTSVNPAAAGRGTAVNSRRLEREKVYTEVGLKLGFVRQYSFYFIYFLIFLNRNSGTTCEMGKDRQKKLERAYAKDTKGHQQQKKCTQTATEKSSGCAIPHVECCVPDTPLPKSQESGVQMTCESEICPYAKNLVHKECFEFLEEKLAKYLANIGRGRNWSETQRRLYMWQKKGRPLIHKMLDCRCGKGKMMFDPDTKSVTIVEPPAELKRKKKCQKELPVLNTYSDSEYMHLMNPKRPKPTANKPIRPTLEVTPTRRRTSSTLSEWLETPKPVGPLNTSMTSCFDNRFDESVQDCFFGFDMMENSPPIFHPFYGNFNPNMPLYGEPPSFPPLHSRFKYVAPTAPWLPSPSESYASIARDSWLKSECEEYEPAPQSSFTDKTYSTVTSQTIGFENLKAFLNCTYKGFQTLLDHVDGGLTELVRECYSSQSFASEFAPKYQWQLDLCPYGSFDSNEPEAKNIVFKVKQIGVQTSEDEIPAEVRVSLIKSCTEIIEVARIAQDGTCQTFCVKRDILTDALQPDGSLLVISQVEFLNVTCVVGQESEV